MKEELLASQKQYASIIQDQTDFIVRWDVDGKITFANRSYLELNG